MLATFIAGEADDGAVVRERAGAVELMRVPAVSESVAGEVLTWSPD
jgi:hypothetical protein